MMTRCKKLSPDQKQELQDLIRSGGDGKEVRRAQAILFVDAETNYEMIQSLTQFKERAVLAFRQRYLKNGLKGIEHKRKGRPKQLLTAKQRSEIFTFLTTTTPKNHGYDLEFWSTSVLANLIEKNYGVVYRSKKPFYLLFKEAKFTFHKPGRVYEKRDESKVQAWQAEMKSRMVEAFEDPDTVILCEDEMVLSSVTTFQKIWLKKGEYPKIEVSNTKKNKSIYGFLNIKSGREHSFMKDWQNMHITVEVLKEIRSLYPSQRILLFWDGAGWHRGSVVQDFIKEDGRIEVRYFPPYSPEENPQEHVWKAGRSAVTHNKFISDIEQLANQLINYLNSSLFLYKFFHFTARS
jgi:transposase